MTTRFCAALVSDGPNKAAPEAIRLFERLIGSWDLEVTWFAKGAAIRRERGEWHFAYVLDGRAVEDVWIVPPRAERAAGAAPYEYGASLRFFDAAIGAWRSTWHGPAHGAVIPFIARAQGDGIMLEGHHADGRKLRWIFSEIAAGSFLWRNEASADDGRTWELQQNFVATRAE
jgi:hypothetical protein